MSKRLIMVPCSAETDLVLKRENSINKTFSQLLALAAGHGQLPKPEANYTLLKCLHHDQGHDLMIKVMIMIRGGPGPRPGPSLIMIVTLIMTLIMIMTLMMTLIMMEHFDKVFVFSGFGSCPWPTPKANSCKNSLFRF